MPNKIADSSYIRTTGAGLWQADLLIFNSLPSTNAWALANIKELKHGDVIRAIDQTAGRGRFNRDWIAPEGCNLNLSVIINHTHNTIPVTMLLPATAIAVRDALKKCNIEAALKWPNDVIVSHKKIAGILAEVEPATNYLVIGIGINVNINSQAIAKMKFPQPPTSMAAENNHSFDINNICNHVLSSLEQTVNSLYIKGISYISQRWQENDYLKGEILSIKNEKEIITGKYVGMHSSGQLEIIDSTGKTYLFWSGDVTLLK